MPRPRFTLLLLNYNGQRLLEQYLPSVLRAARAGGDEVMVVDNCSTDDSAALAERMGARVLALRTNRFLANLTEGARAASNPLLVILNNDVEVAEDFLEPLALHFQDPQVFSVGCRVMDIDRVTVQVARVSGFFENGLIRPVHFIQQLLDPAPQRTALTLYTPGGACAVRRDRFLEIGGYDPLFLPLYWEDVDLCYAAWRRGWKSLYEPESVVVHQHSATVKAGPRTDWIGVSTLKNHFVLTWKNVSDPGILLQSVRSFAWMWRQGLRGQERWRLKALSQVLRQLPALVRRRRQLLPHAVVPDREILPVHVPGLVRAGLGRQGTYPGDLWTVREIEEGLQRALGL